MTKVAHFSLNRREYLSSAMLSLGALSISDLVANAQTLSSRPVRAIVPFSAGSGSDVVARTVFEKVGAEIDRPIVIENRTGAGGTIGAGLVAKAEPDGSTLLLDSSAHTTRPFVYKGLDYDPIADFTTIGSVATIPLVLIVSASKRIKTAGQLAEFARRNPGKVVYASGGTGSATHLPAERFRLEAGFEGVHVPFRGGQEGMREVLAGRVDFYFIPILPALPFIQNGSLNALAVSTSTRSKPCPTCRRWPKRVSRIPTTISGLRHLVRRTLRQAQPSGCTRR